MNVLKMYAIYDVKAGLYGSPHFLKSDGVAIRSFSQVCEDEKTDFFKFPEDFSLYHVGSFDIVSGKVEASTPKQIASAGEFVNKISSERRVSKEEITKFATQQLHEMENDRVN